MFCFQQKHSNHVLLISKSSLFIDLLILFFGDLKKHVLPIDIYCVHHRLWRHFLWSGRCVEIKSRTVLKSALIFYLITTGYRLYAGNSSSSAWLSVVMVSRYYWPQMYTIKDQALRNCVWKSGSLIS